ncbi:MAG: hypothetical protein ABIP03_09225, partial [Aquihabitans sp.]
MASRKTLGAIAMTAALTTGGAVGAMFGTPFASGAQGGTASTTVPAKGDASGSTGRPLRRAAHVDLAVAAKALGMSTTDLGTQLKAGKTIAEVAQSKGVDKQVVVDALVAASEKRLDTWKASLPDRMAKLVDGTLLDGPDGPGRPGGERPGLDAAAKVLGLSTDDLKTKLKAGTSLADVAAAQGVDKQKVIDALVAEATAKTAAAVTDGKITQAEADERIANLPARITKMVNV